MHVVIGVLRQLGVITGLVLSFGSMLVEAWAISNINAVCSCCARRCWLVSVAYSSPKRLTIQRKQASNWVMDSCAAAEPEG